MTIATASRLVEVITAADPAQRDRSIESVCRGRRLAWGKSPRRADSPRGHEHLLDRRLEEGVRPSSRRRASRGRRTRSRARLPSPTATSPSRRSPTRRGRACGACGATSGCFGWGIPPTTPSGSGPSCSPAPAGGGGGMFPVRGGRGHARRRRGEPLVAGGGVTVHTPGRQISGNWPFLGSRFQRHRGHVAADHRRADFEVAA
jgi:hypothetical protein